jgi:hypothetical protein
VVETPEGNNKRILQGNMDCFTHITSDLFLKLVLDLSPLEHAMYTMLVICIGGINIMCAVYASTVWLIGRGNQTVWEMSMAI